MRNHLILIVMAGAVLAPSATLQRYPVDLAYDYSNDAMAEFRLYGKRMTGEWSLIATNAGGTNRGFSVSLPAGSWTFRATAVDGDGQESDPSNTCLWRQTARLVPMLPASRRMKAKE